MSDYGRFFFYSFFVFLLNPWIADIFVRFRVLSSADGLFVAFFFDSGPDY